jgi:hypothetical protein|tara:strand:- start:35 stop:397 length:363 start_codon:yes stop_codon:yes gene_type:complete
MEKGMYKIGWTGQPNVENRFKETEGYDVDVIFSWWLPKEMAYLGEQLLLSTIKKDFYLEEKLDGITEMRKLTLEEKDYMTQSLYNVKKDYLEKFPKYDVKEPWNLGWVKLYFVKVNIYNT